MNLDQLSEFLARQRWFAGKGRSWRLLGNETVAELGTDPLVRIEVAHVRYADGSTETYQVPLVHRHQTVESLEHVRVLATDDGEHGPTVVYDALHDKEVTGRWLTGIAEERRSDTLSFHRATGSPEVPLGSPSLVIGAEQSNTSLIFGDVAILKAFRKLVAGLNPDIEIHDALARAGSTRIAAPIGYVQGTWTDPSSGERVTGSLAMLQEFLHGAAEGWELAKASVRDLFAEGDLHADEVGGDFAAESARLGEATAQVHADLAATLRSDVHGREELSRVAAAMRRRLDSAVAEVPALAPYAERLREAYADLVDVGRTVHVQRVHGDYHLGQVMRTPDGWKLLDFEGEPAKPLSERIALDTPLKDVAGMLRSYDYAARQLLTDRPGEPQLEYRANEWAERNRDAFCTGYAHGAGRDPREDAAVLRAFETDKAVYEVVYEARNRPSWLKIPLSAIERLAAA